jgi:putative aldouronate transport system permease protein
MTFFRGLPPSLEESAKIDGANDMKIFTKIIIPLSMPVIATIALFNGVGAYNDYFTTILYISGEHKHLYTIQYYLYQIINQTQVQAIARTCRPRFRDNWPQKRRQLH